MFLLVFGLWLWWFLKWTATSGVLSDAVRHFALEDFVKPDKFIQAPLTWCTNTKDDFISFPGRPQRCTGRHSNSDSVVLWSQPPACPRSRPGDTTLFSMIAIREQLEALEPCNDYTTGSPQTTQQSNKGKKTKKNNHILWVFLCCWIVGSAKDYFVCYCAFLCHAHGLH